MILLVICWALSIMVGTYVGFHLGLRRIRRKAQPADSGSEGFRTLMPRMAATIKAYTDSRRDIHIDAMPVGVLVSNVETCLYANPAFAAIVGWEIAEIEGKPWESFVHPEFVAPSRAMMAHNLMTRSGVEDFCNLWRRRDGGFVRLRWRISPLTEDNLFISVAEDRGDVDECPR